MHGSDTLKVAGSPLGQGFHWDVQSTRNPSTIATGWEVWRLAGQDGYVNVYPDAGVRKGNQARKVWPCPGKPPKRRR